MIRLVNLPFTLEIFEYSNNLITLFEDIEDVEDDFESIDISNNVSMFPQTKKEKFDIRNWPKPPEIYYVSVQNWPLIQVIFSEKFRGNDFDIVADEL